MRPLICDTHEMHKILQFQIYSIKPIVSISLKTQIHIINDNNDGQLCQGSFNSEHVLQQNFGKNTFSSIPSDGASTLKIDI